MAEKETKNRPKDIIEALPEEIETLESESPEVSEQKPIRTRKREEEKLSLDSWKPRTKLGLAVKARKEKDLDKILLSGKKILEPEILDFLISIETDLISIGQAKGKFGGGKRRAWRQTQKKTKEGNVLTF